MKIIVKLFGIMVAVALLLVVGLTLFVKYYLTDERIRELVVPRATEALNRQVGIGAIEVGLFSGISIRDFVVKERDGRQDFVKAGAFVLRYDLLPLFSGKVVVRELRLDEPVIRIVRDRDGLFNFSDLTTGKKGAEKATPPPSAAPAGLPMAVTIERLVLNKGRLAFTDELDQIPGIEALLNLDLAVQLGQEPATMQYAGKTDFTVTAARGDLRPKLSGRGDISRERLSLRLDLELDEEKIEIDATVDDYLATPALVMELSSASLNLDKIMATTKSPAGSAEQPTAPRQAETGKEQPLAAPLPPGLTAKGRVRLAKIIHRHATIRDFGLQYQLADNILTISDLTADGFGGHLASSLRADLSQPRLVFDGDLAVTSMQASELLAHLAPQASGTISGTLESGVAFAGQGAEWPVIRDNLTADGTFKLQKGGIEQTPVTRALAALLGLPELADLTYEDFSGSFTVVKGGKVNLDTTMRGGPVGMDTAGTVGLDGSLDMPLTLRLSPALGQKLEERVAVARYLAKEEGETLVRLKMTGSVSKPVPAFDEAMVKEQVERQVKEKALELLDKARPATTPPAGEPDRQEAPASRMLRQLLGK